MSGAAAIRRCQACTPDVLGRDKCLLRPSTAWEPYPPMHHGSHEAWQDPVVALAKHARGTDDHDVQVVRRLEQPFLRVEL